MVSKRISEKYDRGGGKYMPDKMFAEYYQIYYVDNRTIQGIARKLAKSDYELYQDLTQTGLDTLAKLDPSKATTNEDAWIRQAMHFRMIDHLRKLKLKSVESLDRRLENGEQIEFDSDTGQVRLIGPPRRNTTADFGVMLQEAVEQNEDEMRPEEEQDGY